MFEVVRDIAGDLVEEVRVDQCETLEMYKLERICTVCQRLRH